MALRLGDTAPNFTAQTFTTISEMVGDYYFHILLITPQSVQQSWAVLLN